MIPRFKRPEVPPREAPLPLGTAGYSSLETDGLVRIDQPVVFILKSVYEQILVHARSGYDSQGRRREVGGALFGHYCRNENQAFMLILDAEPCEVGEATTVHIEFPPAFWEQVGKLEDGRLKGMQRLGPYHSHPGYSVNPSNIDRATYLRVFNRPHHVPLIVDPTLDYANFGFCVWKDGSLQSPTGCFVFEHSRIEELKESLGVPTELESDRQSE